MKSAARSITTQLFRLADARVALVDYKDLYASCPGDGYAARIDLPFSTDSAAFDTAVGTLSAAGGCDTPESVYSGLMAAIGLPWRDGVTKAVIAMGDAPPHDPEPTTGFTRSSVSAAAIAVDPAAIYSINIDGGGSPYFEDLASDTGGKAYPASDPSTAVEQITTAITAITESALIADAGGPYTGTVGEPSPSTRARPVRQPMPPSCPMSGILTATAATTRPRPCQRSATSTRCPSAELSGCKSLPTRLQLRQRPLPHRCRS